MGNEAVSVKNEPQWQWLENNNGVEIYKNKTDGKLAQRRKIALPGTYSLQEEMRAYSFRKNNQFGLVKSYEALQINKDRQKKQYLGNLCNCSNQKILLDVYTERIPQRLSELPQLSFPESLKVLKEATVGFEAAYQKVGGLHINPELIGLNQLGQIRVWVNQNWALNHPSHLIPLLKSSFKKNQYQQLHPSLRDESEMISNLINVIEGKNQQGRFPQPFATQLKSKNNFRTVRKYVNEFIANNKINIPDTIIKSKPKPFDAINKSQFKTNQYPSPFASFSTNPISNGKDYKINPQQSNNTSSNNFLKYTPFDYKAVSFSTPTYSTPLQLNRKEQNKTYLPPTLTFDPNIKYNSSNLDFTNNQHLKLAFSSFLPPNSSITSNSLTKPQSPLFSLNKFFEKDSELKNNDTVPNEILQTFPKVIT